MLIRCQRCSTVYELDPGLLPDGGASVQCTRCQEVFTAYPPGKAPGAARLAPVRADAAAPPPAAPPPLARDRAAAPARRARWLWLAPLLAAAAAAGAYGRHAWVSRGVDPAALQEREEGLRLLARDDAASLERAAVRFAEALALDGELYQVHADRSLALGLLAAGATEDARALEIELRGLDAERTQVETGRPPGWEERSRDLVERMNPLRRELELLQARARTLREESHAVLRSLAAAHPGDVAVERARAVLYALDGEVDECRRAIGAARGEGRPGDAWIDLAEGMADAAGPGGRERALAKLSRLAADRPEMLRARMLLARVQAELQQTDAAVSTLDALLAANPGHRRARALKASLLALPAPAPIAQPPSGARAPPPHKKGAMLPRKAISHGPR